MIQSATYSFPYLLLLLGYFVIFFIEYTYKSEIKIRRQAIIICSVIYILFFGLRGFVGWDWYNYYPYYKNIPPIFHLTPMHLSSDGGFVIYASLFKSMQIGYHGFVFCSTIINVLLLNVFLKRYTPAGFYSFGFIVFLVMGGMFMELDLMRNFKSILLFLISIKYIETRNPIKFFALNFIGLTFHATAIFFLPLYFFLHKPINKNLMLLCFAVGLIIFFGRLFYVKPIVQFMASLLGGKYRYLVDVYFTNAHFSKNYGITIGVVERIGSALLLYLYYPKLLQQSKFNSLFINTFVCYFILFFYFSEVSIISTRLAGLFIFSYWILWPSIIHCMSITNNKIVLLIILTIYIFIKMIGLTNLKINKYDNLIFGIKSYEERTEVMEETQKEVLRND